MCMSLAFRIKPLSTTAPFSLPIKFNSAILLLPPWPHLSGFCDFYWLAEGKNIYILDFGNGQPTFQGEQKEKEVFPPDNQWDRAESINCLLSPASFSHTYSSDFVSSKIEQQSNYRAEISLRETWTWSLATEKEKQAFLVCSNCYVEEHDQMQLERTCQHLGNIRNKTVSSVPS